MREPIEVLTVSGYVGDLDVPRLRVMFKRLAIARRFRIVINGSAIRWSSIAALGFLIFARRVCMRNRGELVLSSPSEHLRRRIRRYDLTRKIRVFDTDESACWYLQSGGSDGMLVPAGRLPPNPSLRAHAVPEREPDNAPKRWNDRRAAALRL